MKKPEHIPTTTVKCFTCPNGIEIPLKPAIIKLGRTVAKFMACTEAPYICGECRLNRAKLNATRRAMEDHFEKCAMVRIRESGDMAV